MYLSIFFIWTIEFKLLVNRVILCNNLLNLYLLAFLFVIKVITYIFKLLNLIKIQILTALIKKITKKVFKNQLKNTF